ncbi:MAG: pyrroline-5-carboxylate reductase [Alphaproteobacteria bacterium]|nr:pyrroline-5-carboxylate reductase [Alphaproteobacteria bacterium]
MACSSARGRRRRPSNARTSSRSRSPSVSASSRPSSSYSGVVRHRQRPWKPPCSRRSARPDGSDVVTEFGVIGADRPLVLVGGGRMGSALLSGWLARGLASQAVVVADPDPEAAARLAEQAPGVRVVSAVDDMVVRPSVVVLAVKPQMMDGVMPAVAVHSDALFLSIAAGKTLAYFAQALGKDAAVVRAMPNTPAAIGRGMTVCVANAQVADGQRRLCTALLGAVGEVAWVDAEKLMDAVTAVSGSGPAYVFYLIECLEAAAHAVGLPAELAATLARRTVAGAGALVEASEDEAPATLRRNVTSPNGTTEAALNVLMAENGLAPLMRHAVEAAMRRSRELSS